MQETNTFRTLDVSAPRSKEDRLNLAEWFRGKAEEADAGAKAAREARHIKSMNALLDTAKRYRATEKKWRNSIG